MKGLIFYIRNNAFCFILQVLHQNNLEGILILMLAEGNQRDEIQKNIDEYQAYITGKKFIPEFVIRKRVEVYVNDSNLQKIIEDEKNWEKFIVRYLFMMLRNLSIYLKILQTV